MKERMMYEMPEMPEVDEMPESTEHTEHTDESGNVFVTNYYGDAVPQMLDAPTRVYTDAHWAVEKAIEVYQFHPEKSGNVIECAEAILAFLNEHAYASAGEDSAGEDAETEVLYNMNASPVYANPQRGSWR